MVSGAGRQDTNRSASALAARFTAACGSSRYAAARVRERICRSPRVSNVSGFPATSVSTRRRSSTLRQAVSRTSSMARHSLILPRVRACSVHGISVVRTLANPSSLPPRFGDSLRARAICDAIPRPRSLRAAPVWACLRRWAASKAAAARACAAAAAALSSSRARIRSMSSASISSASISSVSTGSASASAVSISSVSAGPVFSRPPPG